MEQHKQFMQIAINEAKASTKDVPVGAVLVIDGKIISKSSNKREQINRPSGHAEVVVIDDAAKILNSWRLQNAKLYVTLEPCPMCAALILQSKIKEVYFGAYDVQYGAFGSKLDMRNTINSQISVKGGILEEECKKLIVDFFQEKR
ncbi:MAG: nucleoside deaminase [Candidatus Gastranaerophilales bacterium]|nr:nucleoside deaminase [Candidatus Gastranaerophilales bacterium]